MSIASNRILALLNKGKLSILFKISTNIKVMVIRLTK